MYQHTKYINKTKRNCAYEGDSNLNLSDIATILNVRNMSELQITPN